MDNKKWYQSKTIWINIGAFVLAFIPMIQEHVSSGQTVTVLAVLNILLRAITKSALTGLVSKTVTDDKKDEA